MNVNQAGQQGDHQDADNEQVDHGARDGAFAVAPIPEQLLAEDPHHQGLVHEAIRRLHIEGENEHLAAFNRATVKPTRLSSLQGLFQRQDHKTAIRTLTNRRVLQIDEEFKMDTASADVSMRLGPHYLDYCVHVGNRRGLDAAMGTLYVNHTLTYKITLSQPHRLVNIDHLPFHTKGRQLYLGSRGDESIYLTMVSKTFLVDEERNQDRGEELNAANTSMGTQHYLMITMFIAHALTQMRFQDLHCLETYPVPLTRNSVKRSTDIL